jgi:hypothetical protein
MDKQPADDHRFACTRRCAVSALIALSLGLSVWVSFMVWNTSHPVPFDHTTTKTDDDTSVLRVQMVVKGEGIGSIAKCPRAIVFVDYPFSVPAQRNGEHFLRGVLSLRRYEPGLAADFFWVECDSGDEAWWKEWIDSFHDQRIESEATAGNGFLIWLEHGRVVQFETGDEMSGPSRVRKRTLEVWGKGA